MQLLLLLNEAQIQETNKWHNTFYELPPYNHHPGKKISHPMAPSLCPPQSHWPQPGKQTPTDFVTVSSAFLYSFTTQRTSLTLWFSLILPSFYNSQSAKGVGCLTCSSPSLHIAVCRLVVLFNLLLCPQSFGLTGWEAWADPGLSPLSGDSGIFLHQEEPHV